MLQDKAAEVGRLIGQSAEYQAVKRANESLKDDPEALKALQRMEQLRADAQALIQAGTNPPPSMEEELDALLTHVQGNATYQRMLVAQENFDKVMMQVNQWILDGIRKGATSSIITLG
ncbi:MAG: YlbF family regulator [Gemmatimonadaceae bacterium]|nr:YlbF family regulator [Gemmatimonadaceae bacterium]